MDADGSGADPGLQPADDAARLDEATKAREQEELRSFERRAQWWRSHQPDPFVHGGTEDVPPSGGSS